MQGRILLFILLNLEYTNTVSALNLKLLYVRRNNLYCKLQFSNEGLSFNIIKKGRELFFIVSEDFFDYPKKGIFNETFAFYQHNCSGKLSRHGSKLKCKTGSSFKLACRSSLFHENQKL